MFAHKESKYKDLTDTLHDEIIKKCADYGLSKEIVLEKLIQRFGYKTPRLKPRNKQKVNLTNELLTQLKEEETKIAEQIKENKKVVSMDTNKASYLIETALMSFECMDSEGIMHKKDVDDKLGYKARTMRNQQNLYKEKVFTEGTVENKLYQELCKIIESHSIKQKKGAS